MAWLRTLAAFVLASSSATATPQVVVQDIGQAIGAGITNPRQLNTDGTAFGGSASLVDGGDRAVRWELGVGFLTLETPSGGGGPQSYGWAVDASGGSVFGVFLQLGYRACRWSADGGVQELPSPPGARDLFPFASNASGSRCVGRGVVPGFSEFQPMLWADGEVGQVLPLPPGWAGAELFGISSAGNIAGGFAQLAPGAAGLACRWSSASGFELLPKPFGWTNSSVWAVSDDGNVMMGSGTASDGSQRVFRWTSGTGSVDIGLPSGWSGLSPGGINGDGTMLVGFGSTTSGITSWIWTPVAGVQSLHEYLAAAGADLSGWTSFKRAADVSGDSSTIVGVGTYLGQERVFRVTGLACSSLVLRDSGPLGVIGVGVPREITFNELRQSTGDVAIRIRAVGDFNLASEFLTVRIDGTPVGTAFVTGAQDCPASPDVAVLSVSAKQFNALASDGSVTIRLEASPAVSATQCSAGSCDIRLFYDGILADCDGDGVEDRCQLFADPTLDCDGNSILDSCQVVGTHPDCDGNLVPDSCDLAAGAQDKDGDAYLDECEYSRGDFDLDGDIGGSDLAVLLSLWGFQAPPIGDLNADGSVGGDDLAILLSNWGPY